MDFLFRKLNRCLFDVFFLFWELNERKKLAPKFELFAVLLSKPTIFMLDNLTKMAIPPSSLRLASMIN